jgi:hypothetical protein
MVPARFHVHTPPVLYRYFDEAEHAAAFCRGSIRVSSLASYRAVESDPLRDDALEGSVLYITDLVEGPADDPIVREVARRSGIT